MKGALVIAEGEPTAMPGHTTGTTGNTGAQASHVSIWTPITPIPRHTTLTPLVASGTTKIGGRGGS